MCWYVVMRSVTMMYEWETIIITGKRLELVILRSESQCTITIDSHVLSSTFTVMIFRITERVQHTTSAIVIGFVLKM